MLAIIQAGGAGTRLKSITGDLPKPMVSLDGKPILEWQINSLKRAGVGSFIIVIGKNGETPYIAKWKRSHSHSIISPERAYNARAPTRKKQRWRRSRHLLRRTFIFER